MSEIVIGLLQILNHMLRILFWACVAGLGVCGWMLLWALA